MKRTAIVAGTLAMAFVGLGVGTASASTLAPEQTAVTSARPMPRDFCDDWNHRGTPQCRRGDRWTWDWQHHRWDHDRWDGRDHRWHRR